MPDPQTSASRTGRKLPRHYYTPQPIRQVEGVTRKAQDDWRDCLIGSAEALIAAGVLTPEMLPAPPKCTIAWRPTDRSPQRGESWFHLPGYLEVKRRHDGTFYVLLGVGEEERALRRVAREETDRQDVERSKAMRDAEHERARRERRDAVAAMSADDLREQCLRRVGPIRSSVDGTLSEEMQFEFGPSGRHRIEIALGELEDAIRGAQIVQKRHAGGGKGHLRVAWSAP